MTTDTACQFSPIDGECAAHPGQGCDTRPLPPAQPRPVTTDGPRLHDLPIFAWAWREDGRQLRA